MWRTTASQLQYANRYNALSRSARIKTTHNLSESACMLYTVEGILLNREAVTEYDERVTFLTRERGVLAATAQGTRKVASKISGSLAPFAVLSLSFAPGRAFDRLIGAQMISRFRALDYTLRARVIASLLAQLVLQIGTAEADTRFYKLFLNSLAAIAGRARSGDFSDDVARFMWSSAALKMLALAGFRPQLHICSVCGREIDKAEKRQFSHRREGVLCLSHPMEGIVVHAAVIRFSDALLGSERTTRSYRVSPLAMRELAQLTEQYAQGHASSLASLNEALRACEVPNYSRN